MSQKFKELINSEKPVLIDFFAVWCQPCRVQSSVLVSVKEQVGDNARIIKIDKITLISVEMSQYIKFKFKC